MSQDIDRIINMYNRNYLETKDSNGQYIMSIISKIKDPLTKIKMLQSMAPTMFAISGGHPILNKLSAVAMGSNAITGDSYLKRMDQQAQLKAVNRLERQIGYSNATGDTAFRTITGINNLGMSIGVAGSIAKGLGQAGVIPNVLQNVNPLLLMGAMQGGKGLGTIAAGAAGGLGGLGTALGAGGAGMMGMMNPAMLGVMAMMAMNMTGSKVTDMMKNAGSTNIRKFRASVNLHLTAGTQLELEFSNMVQISSQIKMMTNMNLLTPAETLQANILMMIESHTSVLAPMLAEMKNETEKKQKLGANAGQNVASDFFSEDGLLTLQNQKGTRKNPNFIQRGARHFAQFATNLSSVIDVFGQIGNTLSGKSSTQLFNESNRQSHTIDANQKFSDKYGIAVSMVNTLHTSSAEVLSKADTFEAKHISILAGIYELSRYQGHELLSIRRDGLGVERPGHTGDLAKMRIEEESDAEELETFGKMIDEMMGYIPLWHTISGSAKMVMAGYENMQELILGSKNADGSRTRNNPFTSMLREMGDVFTKSFTQTITDEGSLRDTIGATKLSSSELMARYLSGDYIKQMTDLVNYNRESAHYLKYLAERESARSSSIDRLSDYQAEEALQMDEFSGKLLNKKQMRKRNNAIGKKLRAAIRGVAPNGFLGELMAVLGLTSEDKAEEYNIRKFNHVNELYAQFGNTGGYRGRPRGFAKGGDTGEAAPGTKPDATGEKPVGIVHENEFVINKKDAQNEYVRSVINSMGLSSGKIPETSEQKAKAIHAEEVQANEAINVAKQTDIQTGMVKFLKQIAEYTGIMANPKKPTPKPDDWNLGDLLSLLSLGGAIAGLIAGWKEIKDMVKDNAAILATLAAGLSIPLATKFMSKYLPGAAAGAVALKNGAVALKNGASALKQGTLNAAAGTKFGNIAGIHGPAMPPAPSSSLLDKAKGWTSKAWTGMQSGESLLSMKNVIGAGGKFLSKSAPMLAIMGAFDYFTQDDLNTDGTEKSVGDKLEHTAEFIGSQTGMIIGSVIGGALGGKIAKTPGMIIGSIAGGMLGQKVQDKIEDWWASYGKEEGSTEVLSFEEKGIKFLKANTGSMIGTGIGMFLGRKFGKYGSMIGGMIGGFIGEKVQDAVSSIVEGLSPSTWNITEALGGIADISAGMIGAKLGFAIGGPMGALLGGILTMLLWDGAKALWDKVTAEPKPIGTAESRSVLDAKLKLNQTQDKLNSLIEGRAAIENNKNLDPTKKEKILKAFDLNIAEKKEELEKDQANLSNLNHSTYAKEKTSYMYAAHANKFFTEEVKDKNGKVLSGDDWALNRLMAMKFSESDAKNMLATARAHGMSPAALLAITSQEAGGNTYAFHNNPGPNGSIKSTDFGMYQFNDKARLADLSKNKEIQAYLKSKNKKVTPGDGYALGKAMLGDPILQTKIISMDFEARGKNIKTFIEEYNSNDTQATNQKLHDFYDANIHYGTANSTPVPSTQTSAGQAAKDLEKKAQAELNKKQTNKEKIANEEMISKKESDQKLGVISSQLAAANEHLANMSAKQSALVEAADKASTLWKYIEEVYSTPKFNDAQFSAITIR